MTLVTGQLTGLDPVFTFPVRAGVGGGDGCRFVWGGWGKFCENEWINKYISVVFTCSACLKKTAWPKLTLLCYDAGILTISQLLYYLYYTRRLFIPTFGKFWENCCRKNVSSTFFLVVASLWAAWFHFWPKDPPSLREQPLIARTIWLCADIIARDIQLACSRRRRSPLTFAAYHRGKPRFPFWGGRSEQVTLSIMHCLVLNCWSALNYAGGRDRKSRSDLVTEPDVPVLQRLYMPRELRLNKQQLEREGESHAESRSGGILLC